MNVWRTRRSEDAGPAAEVTSTGLDTFADPLADRLSAGFEVDEHRPPRRLTAVLAFGVLAVSGAVGSYFAVLNGLGSLLAERSPGADPYPLAAGAQGEEATSTAGLGRGHPLRTGPGTTAKAPPARVVVVPATLPPPPPMVAAPRPSRRPGSATTTGDCDVCLSPPVPTPTEPAPSEPAPSGSSPSSEMPSDSPSDSPSATPSAWPSEVPTAWPSPVADPAPGDAAQSRPPGVRESPDKRPRKTPSPGRHHHRKGRG